MKRLRIGVEGKIYEVTVEVIEDTDEWSTAVPSPSPVAPVSLGASVEAPSAPVARAAPAAEQGDIVSPMSATVVSVLVKSGQSVEAGQALLVLEAMKMESTVSAPAAGTVQAVHVEAGAMVGEGQPLISLG
jgi:biotin carboxyl carrier protein